MYKIKRHLPDYTHKLLESYLNNRVFAIRCDTTTFDDYIIKTGVPPGSALGPTLFDLYIADFPTNEQLTTPTIADNCSPKSLEVPRPSNNTASQSPHRS